MPSSSESLARTLGPSGPATPCKGFSTSSFRRLPRNHGWNRFLLLPSSSPIRNSSNIFTDLDFRYSLQSSRRSSRTWTSIVLFSHHADPHGPGLPSFSSVITQILTDLNFHRHSTYLSPALLSAGSSGHTVPTSPRLYSTPVHQATQGFPLPPRLYSTPVHQAPLLPTTTPGDFSIRYPWRLVPTTTPSTALNYIAIFFLIAFSRSDTSRPTPPSTSICSSWLLLQPLPTPGPPA